MAARISLALERMPPWAVFALGMALSAALGVIDYYTGNDLVLSSAFVFPIGLVAWFAGAPLGIITTFISAGIWVTADIADGVYASPFFLILNTVIRVGLFLAVILVLHALRTAIRRLKQSARVDSLTGAASSAWFYESLDVELERLGRYGHPLTLVYMDLDGFKAVNDGFGHLVGDSVLRVVADCAKTRLRRTDIVARLGGDEFAFLCPETDEAAARAAVSEVIGRLTEEMRVSGWPVTFSAGAVTCHEAPASGEVLVKMADDLMYSVKLGTKNAVAYASYGCARADSPLCDEEPLVRTRRD